MKKNEDVREFAASSSQKKIPPVGTYHGNNSLSSASSANSTSQATVEVSSSADSISPATAKIASSVKSQPPSFSESSRSVVTDKKIQSSSSSASSFTLSLCIICLGAL